MEQNELISVIIPTYNGSRYILSTVMSALNQSYPSIEVIVIDDGSTEDIAAILEPVINRINFISQQNRGPAAARNLGIHVSKGNYIAFLDHDDVWEPDNLQAKIAILKKNPEGAMTYSYPVLIDAAGATLPQTFHLICPSGWVFEDFLLQNRIATFSSTLISRDVFDKVGMLDESPEITCCDDYDMWLRIADVDKIFFSPDKNVKYRIHEQNLLKNHRLSLDSNLYVFKKALKECSSVSQMPRKKLSNIINRHLYMNYHVYAFNFYYDLCNYKMTRNLLWQCIQLRPYILKNWFYFLLCSLPQASITRLRTVKSLMTAAFTS